MTFWNLKFQAMQMNLAGSASNATTINPWTNTSTRSILVPATSLLLETILMVNYKYMIMTSLLTMIYGLRSGNSTDKHRTESPVLVLESESLLSYTDETRKICNKHNATANECSYKSKRYKMAINPGGGHCCEITSPNALGYLSRYPLA